MKNVAIITARGGSKRIPKKNIKEFCGKPIIRYSIEAAIDSGIFDEIMISTDDLEIAQVAKELGAKVPFLRSKENSNDYATTSDVIKEVLDNYKKEGNHFDIFCCIYPTAPFITGMMLKEAMEKLANSSADSILPVVRFSYPPQRALVITNDRVHMKWPDNMNLRSQDFESYYHDAGQFYIMKVESFYRHQKIITDKTIPYIISEKEVQDIDNPDDWIIAELKFRYNKGV